MSRSHTLLLLLVVVLSMVVMSEAQRLKRTGVKNGAEQKVGSGSRRCKNRKIPKDNSTRDRTFASTTTFATTIASPEPVSKCGVSTALDDLTKANSGVVGGISAGSCDVIPWQVKLTRRVGRLCGGSILDASHILTAAACIPDSGTFEVTAGDYDITATESSEQRRTVSVQNVTIHPDFVFNHYARPYDLAVVKLSEPLDLSQPCVSPVCLDPNLVITGQHCTVSGWMDKGVDTFDELQIASVRTALGENCQDAFYVSPQYLLDPSGQLCAGYTVDGVDACQGLVGGPLVCRDDITNTYIQAGITSTAGGCGLVTFPPVYTKVSAFYDWIQEQIKT